MISKIIRIFKDDVFGYKVILEDSESHHRLRLLDNDYKALLEQIMTYLEKAFEDCN